MSSPDWNGFSLVIWIPAIVGAAAATYLLWTNGYQATSLGFVGALLFSVFIWLNMQMSKSELDANLNASNQFELYLLAPKGRGTKVGSADVISATAFGDGTDPNNVLWKSRFSIAPCRTDVSTAVAAKTALTFNKLDKNDTLGELKGSAFYDPSVSASAKFGPAVGYCLASKDMTISAPLSVYEFSGSTPASIQQVYDSSAYIWMYGSKPQLPSCLDPNTDDKTACVLPWNVTYNVFSKFSK